MKITSNPTNYADFFNHPDPGAILAAVTEMYRLGWTSEQVAQTTGIDPTEIRVFFHHIKNQP